MARHHHYKPCDWIIYRPDVIVQERYIKCVAVGSERAARTNGTVVKGGGFFGTYLEARDVAEIMNDKFLKELRRKGGRVQSK